MQRKSAAEWLNQSAHVRLHEAEDRAFRIGQTRTVNIVYMTAPDTYDEVLSAKLLEKTTLVMNWEAMTDEEVNALNPKSEVQEMLAYIMSKRKIA